MKETTTAGKPAFSVSLAGIVRQRPALNQSGGGGPSDPQCQQAEYQDLPSSCALAEKAVFSLQ
jgi:hypothetical protein